MDSSYNSLLILFVILLLAYITHFKKVVELFSYYKNDIAILSNTIDIYNTKTERNLDRYATITTSIDEETLAYNNMHCNEYSLFYKLDTDNPLVKNKKTYVKALLSNEKGVYSPITQDCKHPFDPEFKNFVDCEQKLMCNNGLLISGKPVIKDNEPSCVYDCIQHFSK